MRPNWLPERTLPDGTRPFPRSYMDTAAAEVLLQLDERCDRAEAGYTTLSPPREDRWREPLTRLVVLGFARTWWAADGRMCVGITQAGDRALERAGR